MREALNTNPVAQAAIVGLLVIAVAFLLMTRVLNRDEGGAEPASEGTSTTISETSAPLSSAEGQEIAAGINEATDAIEAGDAEGALGAIADAAGAPPGAVQGAIPGAAIAVEFKPGKGLPKAVVRAHDSGDAVALLITRKAGIEDKRLRAMLGRLEGVGKVTAFHTRAHDIARYSQVTNGVQVSRVPALIVVHPGKRGESGPPLATVSYGFRGPESAEQALRDALYSGRKDLPYYPE